MTTAVRIGWSKVTPYGIVSTCGRYRIGKFNLPCGTVYALYDGVGKVMQSYDPDECRKAAAMRLAQEKAPSD